MKKQLTIHLFKTSFIILSFILLFNGCSKSEDTDNNLCDTFIECQDGTVWEGTSGDGSSDMILEIWNVLTQPFKSYTDQGECWRRDMLSSYNDEDQFRENSKNRLIVRYTSDSHYEETSFIVSGNTLTILVDYVYEDHEDEHYNLTLTKSSINTNSLTICQD